MDSPRHRVFLALWPDSDLRGQLAGLLLHEEYGRPIPIEHLHLTLVFIGMVDDQSLHCIGRQLSQFVFSPFDVTLDQFGYFAKPRIFWVGPSRIPSALSQLSRQMIELCRECAVHTSVDRFVPHVSLFRECLAPRIPHWRPALHWKAERLVLVESGVNGNPGHYRIVAARYAREVGSTVDSTSGDSA